MGEGRGLEREANEEPTISEGREEVTMIEKGEGGTGVCLGALDGTFIDVRVPEHDKGCYCTRKGQVAVNVLGVCHSKMQFIFVLSGWEGSAAHSRVLRDAIHRPNVYEFLLVSIIRNYYLCNNGYAKADGFLTPYRGVRYHLREWDRKTGTMDSDFISTAYVNTLEDDSSSQYKGRGNNKDRSRPQRSWTIVEEDALINGLKSLVTTGWKCENG
ncbi:hypothetical protein Sango_2724500 [Sesamum angolense]|uniref:DDE Tnp4 domain-containing protein n=1 Tax=Sesamum angolense TaxID=2727404 RepID=A0AAE1T8L3_9LAMI|nr:hypothetical protein Sango_2724500 [Sesamum angolense]